MISVPRFVTACTGFDAFCHAFESILHPGKGAYVELLAWEAIRIVFGTLPGLLSAPADVESREQMAWADTLAGLCIANAGVTLPHGIGMAIGGLYPHVAHGEALALIYPEFCELTWPSAIPEFARMSRLLNPTLRNASDKEAAAAGSGEISKFLKTIGLSKKLKDVDVPEEELEALAKQSMVLPDYKNNPKQVNLEEMLDLLKRSFDYALTSVS
jgi:alcohol dehydrogenase class IV